MRSGLLWAAVAVVNSAAPSQTKGLLQQHRSCTQQSQLNQLKHACHVHYADPKQLAEFWDGLSEADRRTVMAVKEEHNGERTLREVRGWFRRGEGQFRASAQQTRRWSCADLQPLPGRRLSPHLAFWPA